GERLERDVGKRKAVAGPAEDLSGRPVVIGKCAIEETRERNRPIRADRVESVVRAGTQIERAEAPAAVCRNVSRFDIRRAAALEIVLRAGVARRDADASMAADARIDARDEAREIAAHGRRIAVAVEVAPRPKTLR